MFVVDTFYGARMAGHQPVLSADGPRSLLSEATPLPIALEERLRSAYTTGRRQELLVRRGDSMFAVELLPDNGGVTALWSEHRGGPARDPETGVTTMAAMAARPPALPPATVEGDPVACVVLRAERDGTGDIIDFVCELSVADDHTAAQLPRAGERLSVTLPAGGRRSVIEAMGQCVDGRRPFRPPRGLVGSMELEQRCELRGLAFGDRTVVWLRTRPHTRSVVDLREQDQVTLTRREREILLLLAEGASTTEIARTLYLSTNTVRNHVRRLLSHLGASSRLEAVVVAAKMGLLELRREPDA